MSESEPTRQTTARLEIEERDPNSSGNGANGEFSPSSINHKSSTATTEQRPEVMEEGGARDEETLEELRLLLLGHYQGQMVQLQQTIDELSTRTADKEGLIRTITPVMGDLIRNKIRDNRDEMIEALYPIIGQLVMRAVSEAVRELARKMDTQLRTTYSISYQSRRLWARLNGVSESDLILRDSLPFRIAETFLIHRQSGLLLWHESQDQENELADADLISSMLTAIRDFAADAFGNNEDERLDEIQYGEHQILIETAQHVYIAVVADGVEPAGFRNALRRQVIDIQHHHYQKLADYDGDASHFVEIGQQLNHQLMRVGRSKPNARPSHAQIKPHGQRVEMDGTAHKPHRAPTLIQYMRGKRKTGHR